MNKCEHKMREIQSAMYCVECIDARESLTRELVEALTITTETLRDLDGLNWEPEGRPFNWDEVMDKAESLITRAKQELL